MTCLHHGTRVYANNSLEGSDHIHTVGEVDLFTFRDNLFNLSHSLILSSSVLIKNSTFSLYCAKESRVLESVVSSVYIIKLNHSCYIERTTPVGI